MSQQALEDRGFSRHNAALAARRLFGSPALAHDRAQDVWVWPWLSDLWHDLRFAGKLFINDRWFTLTAVITLAVGIAAITVMFALIEAVLLRPLPVGDQDRLLVAWTRLPSTGFSHFPYRAADVAVVRESSQILAQVAGVGHTGAGPIVMVESDGQASYVNLSSVSGDFFAVLDVVPLLGRGFTRADDLDGAEGVMVLGHRLWQRRYAGSHTVIGRRITVGERPFTIVGVMPRDLEYPRGAEAWITVAAHTSILTNPAFRIDVDLVARLRPGATIPQAVGELQRLTERLEAAAPAGVPRGLIPVVRPFVDVVVGDVRPSIMLLFGAVGLVLFIAMANTATLLVLRAEARQSELAVRAALGAGQPRLTRQLLAEGLLLSVVAGGLGLATSWWTLQALITRLTEWLPRGDAVLIDAGVVAFSTAVIFVSATLIGLAPAWSATRVALASQLRSGAVTASRPLAWRGRRFLVVAQVALAVTVVASAGLLLRSQRRLQAVDMGWAAEHLTFVELALPQARYGDRENHLRFLADVVAQLEAMPGIAAVTPVNVPPFSGTAGWDLPLFTAEGQNADRAAINPSLNLESVHPNYFDTFRIALLRGRMFSAHDRADAPLVAIVSEDVAARTWPGENPIGKRLKFGELASTQSWRTVVGVTRATRYRDLREARPTLYLPAEQFIVASHLLVLRTELSPGAIAAIARGRVHALDPGVQIMRVAPFVELLDEPLAGPRFIAILLAAFGSTATAMGTIGVYAVVAASVRRRNAEIGVRLALGATASQVRRLIIGEGLRLASLGVTIGLLATATTSRLLQSLLFEVHPLDPSTILLTALSLVGICTLACYLPARRAARVDPTALLRPR